MINWRVRIKNRNFWIAFIPAVLLLIRVALRIFDIEIDMTDIQGKLQDVVNAAFAVLAILGVVTDPTTAGIGDSARALTYTEPKE